MDSQRKRAAELVQVLMSGATDTEAEADAVLAEFESLVPDPNAANLIFWPSQHPLSRDIASEDLTPDRIVELAFEYKPFPL
jgi:hypothetical protein